MNARIVRLVPAPLVIAGLLAACGGSTAVTASKTAFCSDNAKLDKATVSATTAGQALTILKANLSTITDFGKVAPADIKAAAAVLVKDATTAIKANSPAALNDPKFQTAGPTVDAYCGQDSSGSPLASGTTT